MGGKIGKEFLNLLIRNSMGTCRCLCGLFYFKKERIFMNENNKGLHRDCEPHDAAHCDINEHDNLEPGADDCGHRAEPGPGAGPQKAADQRPFCAPDPTAPSSINGDQHPNQGPGVAK